MTDTVSPKTLSDLVKDSYAPPPGSDPHNIRSMLPDGTILEFPPDTAPDVVDRVFRQKMAELSPEKIGTGRAAGIGVSQGLTFNLGDEMAAGIGATIGRPGGEAIPGATWGERYDNALNIARNTQHAAQDQHPYAYGTGQVGGAVLPALVAPELYGANWIARAPSLANAAGRSALIGGAAGALAGFGGGEGGAAERLKEGAVGGVTGAGVGAAAVPVSRAIGAAIGGRAPNPTVPTNDELRAAGQAAYQTADNAGVIIAPQAVQGLENTIRNDLGGSGFDASLHPRIMAAYRRILQQAQSGQPITLRGLDILRQIVGEAGDSASRGERRLATQMINHIDDFVDHLDPGQLVAGDPGTAVPALQNARQVWSSLRKSELVDELVHTAELQAASTNSGGNAQNAIRQKLRTLLTNRSLGRGFTDEERQALEEIVRGTATQNSLRTLGRLAPSSNSWLGVLSTLAGGPAGALVPVIGAAAKGAANRSTQSAVQGLSELVRSGAGIQNPAPQQLPSLAQALLAGTRAGGSSMGANYANALLRPQQ